MKGEQGRGDVIQFLRYISPLAARGRAHHVERLSRPGSVGVGMPDVERVFGPDEDETEYDQLTAVDEFAAGVCYRDSNDPGQGALFARACRQDRPDAAPSWAPDRGRALAWHGPVRPPVWPVPRCRRRPWNRYCAGPDVEFHCLQKEIRAEDRAWLERIGVVTTHEAMLRDFGDTAALIEAMDLVISIDTAVAHLAGALAKPVWIMLPFNPDWRWLLGRDDSPWYPTARLFRQPVRGDWDAVLRSVAASLQL